jgi:hypothetical protein
MYNKLLSVSDLKDIRRKILPVLVVGSAFEEFDILEVLRIPAGKLPINHGLKFPVFDNDIARREITVGESYGVIRPHASYERIAYGFRTLLVNITDESVERSFVCKRTTRVIAKASTVASRAVDCSDVDFILTT